MKWRVSIVMVLALSAVATALGDTAGSVEFTVTTRPTRGAYAPRHVIAIWVTDGRGDFVKTLELCAQKRKRHLDAWARSSMNNAVDAVTGATLKAHRTHTVRWNCRDRKGNLMPDGAYQLHVEFTDTNGPGPVTPPRHIQFMKGPAAVSLTPGNLPFFEAMKLNYLPQGGTPASTGRVDK